MIEDDIQYMGTKFPSPDPKLGFSPFPSGRPLAGITLNVEQSLHEDACRLVFRRANATVIQIGRRPPSNDPAKRLRDTESGKAMFKCPVVSRKHAKITFSDSGFAYIMDLGSHHGTHIRRKDELLSKMLTPHVATMLTDGDIITFGKSVAKSEGIVRPVVARVELSASSETPHHIRDGQLKPLIVPEVSESPDPKPIARSLSGRFYVPSSGESDGSDSDPASSDIEESPSSSPKSSSHSLLGPASVSSIGRAFDAFKSLIPSPASQSQSQPAQQRLPPINLLRPIPVIGFDDTEGHDGKDGQASISPSPSKSPSLPNPQPAAEPMIVGAWPTSADSSPISSPVSPIIFPDMVHFPFIYKSPYVLSPEENNSEKLLADEGPQDNVDKDEDKDTADGKESEKSATAPLVMEDSSQKVTEVEDDIVPLDPMVVEQEETPATKDEPNEVATALQALNEVKNDVERLSLHRRRLKARLNNHSNSVSNSLSGIKDELAELKGQVMNMSELVEGAVHFDIPDLQGQIDELKKRLDAGISEDEDGDVDMETKEEVPDILKDMVEELQRKVAEMVEKEKQVREEEKRAREQEKRAREEEQKVRKGEKADIDTRLGKAAAATVAQLNDIQARLDSFQSVVRDTNHWVTDDACKEMIEEYGQGRLDAIQVARDEALRAIADAQTQAMAALNNHASSLKRKREEEEEGQRDKVAPPTLDEPAPKRPRRHRVASAVVKTAGMITMGAVVTWGALAFT